MTAAIFRLFSALLNLADFFGKVTDPIQKFFVQGLGVATATLLDFINLLTKIPGVDKAFSALGFSIQDVRTSLTKAKDGAIDLAAAFDPKSIRNSAREISNNIATSIETGTLKASGFVGKLASDIDNFANKSKSLVGTVAKSASDSIKNIPPIKVPVDTEKLEKDLKDAITKGSANIGAFLGGIGDIKKAGGGVAEIAATGAAAFASSIKSGAEGARQAVVAGLTTAATAFLGPVGQALGPVFDLLSQGPEKVKEMVNQFISAIPNVLKNILLAVPALILSLIDSLPVLIDGLLSALPEVIQGFIDAIPLIIDALVSLQPQITQAVIDNLPAIISAFALLMPQVAIALSSSLIQQAPTIGAQMAFGFIAQIPNIVSGIAEGVKQAISNLGGSLGGGGGLLGKVGGAVGGIASIGKKLKFADGGVVPGGFPNDSFPAQLTSGEGVIPVDTMRRLDQYLSGAASIGGSGGGGTTIIKLVVGEQELASVMLGLSQRGFRTSV
jgi:phage-related protein